MKLFDTDKGIFPISVVAEIVGASQKQLRTYDTYGIVSPTRNEGNRRLYSSKNILRLQYVHHLFAKRRINLEGIKAVLEVLERLPEDERMSIMESVEGASSLQNLQKASSRESP